jgi:hypothetical protein
MLAGLGRFESLVLEIGLKSAIESVPLRQELRLKRSRSKKLNYRRTSISGKKKAQITFPLINFFLPLKVVK